MLQKTMGLNPFLLLILTVCACTNTPKERVEIKQGDGLVTWVSNDLLIAKLAEMETDTLDCSAEVYWEIVGKGKEYIPPLIESLIDTTPTNIYHGCKPGNLNIGELSYFALAEIGDFPEYIVTQIEFDLIENKNGWICWNFLDYIFKDRNKVKYQSKVKSFYEQSLFEFAKYPDSEITSCMRHHSISGKYKWKGYKPVNPLEREGQGIEVASTVEKAK